MNKSNNFNISTHYSPDWGQLTENHGRTMLSQLTNSKVSHALGSATLLPVVANGCYLAAGCCCFILVISASDIGCWIPILDTSGFRYLSVKIWHAWQIFRFYCGDTSITVILANCSLSCDHTCLRKAPMDTTFTARWTIQPLAEESLACQQDIYTKAYFLEVRKKPWTSGSFVAD